jgi:hypothetical protein
MRAGAILGIAYYEAQCEGVRTELSERPQPELRKWVWDVATAGCTVPHSNRWLRDGNWNGQVSVSWTGLIRIRTWRR